MSNLSLKVMLVDQGTTKTMQFAGGMTVSEVCRDIRERIGDKQSAASDHGIFFPILNKWLAHNRTLDFYDLKSGDSVEFKKKHRPLRVRLVDGAVKTVLVDDSQVVADMVEQICKKIGIQNWDEFSLQHDAASEAAQAIAAQSDRLRKVKPEEKDKMAEDGRWLNPEKSLAEQGVQEADVLLLKKKFYFSDQNVDRNDPIQLNLIYVQARDQIVSGKCPCTYEEASQLAALQCQVQFGNHEPDKHKPGFIKLKDFVPPEYHKEKKELEKKIFQEHRKLQGLNELNGKFRYVQLCRSMKTYGVTFFQVKEKSPGKTNKMVVRLLGVTRDSIMRVDAESKEVLKVWPLTTLRRWAAAPNTFTLDFGDYADAYYSVMTQDGEAINQLIAGYIDIIMRKRKDASRAAEEDESQVAISEDNVKAIKGTAVNVQSKKVGRAVEVNVASAGVTSDDGNRVGMKQIAIKKTNAKQAQYGNEGYSTALAQQSLMQTINNGYASINNAQQDLNVAMQMPPIGNDAASQQWKQQTTDVNRQTIASQIGSHLAATAAIINLTAITDLDQVDFAGVGMNISALGANLGQISTSTKMLAALSDGSQGDKLLEAARSFAAVTGKILGNIQPMLAGDSNPKLRQDVLRDGEEIAKQANLFLQRINEAEISQAAQQELIDAAKDVAKATIQLVTQGAKPMLTEASADKRFNYMQPEIMTIAKAAAAAAETLVTCTKIAAPTIQVPACQDQVWEGTLFVKDAVNALNETVEPLRAVLGNNAKASAELLKASQRVNEAIAKLIEKTKNFKLLGGAENGGDPEFDALFDQVSNASSNLIKNGGNAGNIINAAKSLVTATAGMVNLLKQRAQNHQDPAERDRILAAAQALSDASAKMVAAAKDAARNPNDSDKQKALAEATAAVEKAMMMAAGDSARQKIYSRLADAAKQFAASTTQLVGASKNAAPSNRNQASQMQLNATAKKSADTVTNLIMATKNHLKATDDTAAQLKLISAAKSTIAPAQAFASQARTVAATTADEAAQQALISSSLDNATALATLLDLVQQAESASNGLEIVSALKTLKDIQEDIADGQKKLLKGELRAPLGQSQDTAAADIMNANKNLTPAVIQMVTAAQQGNDQVTGASSRDAVSALQVWAQGVRNLAATSSSDPDIQKGLMEAAAELASRMEQMIKSAKNLVDAQKSGSADSQAVVQLNKQIAELNQGFNEVVATVNSALPGQRDLDKALNLIAASVDLFANGPVTKLHGETFQMAQSRLNAAAAALSLACNSLVNATKNGTVQDIRLQASQFEDAFNKMTNAAKAVAGQTNDDQVRADVAAYFNELADSSYRLIQSTKSAQTDQGARGNLHLAAKVMADSISKLLDTCTTSAPGLSECNQADKLLNQALAKLDLLTDPLITNKHDTFFECVSNVSDITKKIGAALAITNSAIRSGDAVKLGQTVMEIASGVDHLTDSSVRASYLIGISDPSSVAAIPGSVDAAVFLSHAHDVETAIAKLTDPSSNQQTIMSAASQVAKGTGALCAACKTASQNSSMSPVAKQQFINMAKGIATNTNALVQNIKALAANPSQDTRSKTEQGAVPLNDVIKSLISFVNGSEFAGTPAQISPVAMQTIIPILESNRNIVSVTQDVIHSVKNLITASSSDSSAAAIINSQVKGISDTLRVLINSVKQSAPGQKDCADAIEAISSCLGELDGALLQVDVGGLSIQDKSVSLTASGDQSLKESLIDNARALASLVEMICNAAKGKRVNDTVSVAAQLGAAAQQLAANFKPTTTTAVSFASSTEDKNSQRQVLEDVKLLGDSALALLIACKEVGGDANATQLHGKVDASRQQFENAVADVIGRLEGSAEGTEEINQVASKIQAALGTISDLDNVAALNAIIKSGVNYPSMVQEIAKNGRKLVELSGEVVSKSSKPSADVTGPLSEKIGEIYGLIIQSSQKAGSLALDPSTRQGLFDAARDLGGSALRLVESMKSALVAANNSSNGLVDNATRQKVANSAREVSQGVAKLMTVSKEGSKGIMACEQVLSQLNDLISDIDSTVIFTQAGQLDPLDSNDTFALYSEILEKNARDVLEISKAITSGAASGNQEELASAVTNCLHSISTLAESTKKGASAITSADKNMQEQLLLAAKEVAEKLQALVNSAMDASGKPIALSQTGTVKGQGEEIAKLRNDAKNLVQQVNEYFKIVRLVGDESSRGLRAIDGAVVEIQQGIKCVDDGSLAVGSATPEEVVSLAKMFAQSAALLVSASGRAGGTQDELIHAISSLKKTGLDLFRAGHASIDKAPAEQKIKMVSSLKRVAQTTVILFTRVRGNLENPSAEAKTAIQSSAKDIAGSVNLIVEAAGDLIPGGYVDPNDPNVIAERELLAAASSIEAAARKLAQLKPVERVREANEDLPFEEQIIEAAKAIASATGALVRSATAAQREIVAKGKASTVAKDKVYFSDGTWSDGLVSAAKAVALATGDLCDSANSAVKGEVSRERVVAASRAVSSSTVQLLAAASVKSDPSSQAQARLRAAGKSVTNATEHLVKAAESSMAFDDNSTNPLPDQGNSSNAMQRAKELDAQARVLQMEKELEQARNRLNGMRKAKYK